MDVTPEGKRAPKEGIRRVRKYKLIGFSETTGRLLDRTIDWPDKLPMLKTWAGGTTIKTMLLQRLSPGARDDQFDHWLGDDWLHRKVTVTGRSGLRDYVSPLDLGSAPTQKTRFIEPAYEVLSFLGVDRAVVGLRVSDRRAFFDAPDGRWSWTVEALDQYRKRWLPASRVAGEKHA